MGLTATGYVAPTIEELKQEIEDDEHALVDAALDVSAEQPIGQINAIFAKKLAEAYEVVAVLANAMNPNGAENFMLDNQSALTGTVREPQSKSVVAVNCTVNNGFTQPAGAIMLNVDGFEDIRFVNRDDVGPLTAGTHSIVFEAVEYGPVAANAGTLTVITNAISGLNSVTNPLDAERGSFVETDAELRARREEELAAPGACTVDAIRADLLQVPGVHQAFVYENTSLTTDENGLPGKSIECVIYDGSSPEAANADVASVVWGSKPSGSETYGSITETVDDSTGVPRTVKFSRATVKNVWLEFDVTVDPNFFPADGATLIKDAAEAYGARVLNLGVDVFAQAFKAQCFQIAGVLDVTALRLGFTSSPVGTANLTITGREIADVDTSRMTVTTSNGVP